MAWFTSLIALLTWAILADSQTFTSCDPLKGECPPDPALGKTISYDFTKGSSPDWVLSTGAFPTFDTSGDAAGAHFTVAKTLDSPTMTSKWYLMFGHYDIVLRTSPGVGVVSSLVLQSDDLDEIDFEWLGADDQQVQTNYFGKGNTTTYDRGGFHANPRNQDDFHTYSVDWTSDKITWAIDGRVIRTLTAQTAETNQYPQTPMQITIGTWPSGDPAEPAGVIQWGGGPIDYKKGPYVMTVKSIKAIDYSTGKSYSYGDHTGSWQSIKSDGGKINGAGDPNAAAEAAPMNSAATSAVPSGANATTPAAGVNATKHIGFASTAPANATGSGAVGPSNGSAVLPTATAGPGNKTNCSASDKTLKYNDPAASPLYPNSTLVGPADNYSIPQTDAAGVAGSGALGSAPVVAPSAANATAAAGAGNASAPNASAGCTSGTTTVTPTVTVTLGRGANASNMSYAAPGAPTAPPPATSNNAAASASELRPVVLTAPDAAQRTSATTTAAASGGALNGTSAAARSGSRHGGKLAASITPLISKARAGRGGTVPWLARELVAAYAAVEQFWLRFTWR